MKHARRHFTLAATAGLLLAGCGSVSPPTQLYRLPLTPPETPPETVAPNLETWELAGTVTLPEYLDRDTLLVATSDTGLQALQGQRWSEPLRDAIPRLLRADLAALHGAATTWPAPAPQGVIVDRRLAVEIQTLLADATRGEVLLQARWTSTDPRGLRSPTQRAVELRVPVAAGSPNDIARAHRLVLWQMARRIAGR